MDREVEKTTEDRWGQYECCHKVPLILTSVYVQRQFQRLVEMLILLHLDPSDSAGLRAYRLQVKERLYRFNFVCVTCLCLPYFNTWGGPFLGNSSPTREGRKTRKTGRNLPKCLRRLSQNSSPDSLILEKCHFFF